MLLLISLKFETATLEGELVAEFLIKSLRLSRVVPGRPEDDTHTGERLIAYLSYWAEVTEMEI